MHTKFTKLFAVIVTTVMLIVNICFNYQDSIRQWTASAATAILGDINGDGRINAKDMTLYKRALLNNTELSLDVADLNADGVADIKDVYELQDYLLCKQDLFTSDQTQTLAGILDSVNELNYSIVTQNEPTETSLTAEIAKEVDNATSPVAVYELLYNNVDTEFYFGSRKGAIGTYDQHGGNDIDQASLLIASLHHLGYDADYISGLVRLTPEQAMQITGTNDIDVALNIFKAQAPSDIKKTEATYNSQNQITSITVEHTWVKASIPSKYVKSNGTDELIEVQMDSSFKEKQRMSITKGLDNIIGTENKKAIVESMSSGYYESLNDIINDITDNNSSKTLDDMLPDREYKAFNLLPSFDYEIVSNTVDGEEYLSGRRDQIQIAIDGGNAVVLNAVDVYGKRLVVEYDFDGDYEIYKELLLSVPQSIFDIKQSDTKAGIRVQPYIKLDGTIIGTGGSVEIGTEQKMTITVYTCGSVQELKPTNMLSGSMYAINIDSQNIASSDLLSSIQSMSQELGTLTFRESYKDSVLGRYLSSIGRIYMSESDLTKAMYAEQYEIHAERYLSVCVTAFNLEIVPNIVGQLEVQESGTIGLDVKSDSFSAVSLKSNQDDISKFYLNVGIKGSYLEGEVLETVTGIECVSTMKVLDAARAQKIDIITISKSDSNYKSLLSTLESNNIPAYALEEITEKVEAGCKVITPIKNVRINSWNGIGYIINNANEYSFMLSNGTNGGETTEPVRDLNALWTTIVFWAFVIALIFCIVSFCSAAWVFVPILAGDEALTFGAIASVTWSAYAVSSAADGLGDVIEGTATTGTAARVTVTTFGKSLWKFAWKLIHW